MNGSLADSSLVAVLEVNKAQKNLNKFFEIKLPKVMWPSPTLLGKIHRVP